MFFPIYVDPLSRRVSLSRSEEFCVEVLPRKSTGEDGRWEWGPKKADRDIHLLEGVLRTTGAWDILLREFIHDGGEERTVKWKSVWEEKEINYQNGKRELGILFDGDNPMDFPKPTYLIRKIIEGSTDSEDLVCDFFAGSGTTGHAVFDANAADGGSRRFIVAQLPEPTGRVDYPSISSITKERLRRAAKKTKDENPMFSGDLGFRVFKLDSSNVRTWEPDRDDLETSLEAHADPVKPDRSEQDLLFELLLKLGLDLTVPIEARAVAGKTVHSIGAGTLMTCLGKSIAREEVEALATGIIAWHAELAPAGDTQLVFRDSAFSDDVAKTNLVAILVQSGFKDEFIRSL